MHEINAILHKLYIRGHLSRFRGLDSLKMSKKLRKKQKNGWQFCSTMCHWCLITTMWLIQVHYWLTYWSTTWKRLVMYFFHPFYETLRAKTLAKDDNWPWQKNIDFFVFLSFFREIFCNTQFADHCFMWLASCIEMSVRFKFHLNWTYIKTSFSYDTIIQFH